MRFIAVAAILLVHDYASIVTAAESSAFASCEAILNQNAKIEPQHYGPPHARNKDQYSRFLGDMFSERYNALSNHSTFIDIGGGYGVAALQAAIEKGARATVVNAQNFWKYFEEKSVRAEIKTLAPDLHVSFAGVPATKKRVFGINGEFELYSYDLLEFRHWELLAQRIVEQFKTVRSNGTFNYVVGFAENELPAISLKADLLTDLYGAYFYSADRLGLLSLYYGKLADAGLGFIRLKSGQTFSMSSGQENGIGPTSTVHNKYGRQKLEDWLIEQYPDIFSYENEHKSVLILKRSPNFGSLDLSKRLTLKKHVFVKTGRMHFPNIDLVETN